MKKIIAFAGSNHSKSVNQQLIEIVSAYVKTAEVEVLNLRNFEAVMYGLDEEENNGYPESMKRLHKITREADGFIVASPEYNGMIPSVFKNTIDWLSRMGGKVFNEKPVVFLSSSPGPRGGVTALGQLLSTMPYRGAKVVGGHGVGNINEKIEGNELVAGEDKESILKLLKQLEEEL